MTIQKMLVIASIVLFILAAVAVVTPFINPSLLVAVGLACFAGGHIS